MESWKVIPGWVMAELVQERKDAHLSFESYSEKVWLEGEDVHLYSQYGKVNNWCAGTPL